VICNGLGEIIVKEEDRDTCPECRMTGIANKNIGELLMLIVSELGEAIEAHRKNEFAQVKRWKEESYTESGKKLLFEKLIKDSFEDELADAVIRIFDMCGYLKINLEEHIVLKMWYNSTREHKHGKEY